MLSSLEPRPEFDIAARLKPREAKALLAARLKGQMGGKAEWSGNEAARDALARERLLSERSGNLTRLGHAVARALISGFLPAADAPVPRLAAATLRTYRERVYRVRHRGQVVTSSCQPARKVGDRGLRMHLAEFGDFPVPEDAGTEEKAIYRDGKGSRLLRERLDAVLPLFARVPTRVLHPLLYDTRGDELVLVAFVDGDVAYVRADAKYTGYLAARHGEDLHISASLAELRAAGDGDPISLAFSSGGHLRAILAGHARKASDGRRLEEALAATYDIV